MLLLARDVNEQCEFSLHRCFDAWIEQRTLLEQGPPVFVLALQTHNEHTMLVLPA